MTSSQQDIRIVNGVYRGLIGESVNLREIEKDLITKNAFKITLYQRRPNMLCIKCEGGCLTLFSTGRFRIMGKPNTTSRLALFWNDYASQRWGNKNFTLPHLTLQTQTLNFKVSSDTAQQLLLHHSHEIHYEPELFTAIRILKWSDIHVNLFFTGNVIILGRNAYKHACEVKCWLENDVGTNTVMNSKISIPSDPYEEAIRCISKHLPTSYSKRAIVYLNSFPRRLIFSWQKRLLQETNTELIPYLCHLISPSM